MAERQLPEQFQDLEPYLAWSLATERERPRLDSGRATASGPSLRPQTYKPPSRLLPNIQASLGTS